MPEAFLKIKSPRLRYLILDHQDVTGQYFRWLPVQSVQVEKSLYGWRTFFGWGHAQAHRLKPRYFGLSLTSFMMPVILSPQPDLAFVTVSLRHIYLCCNHVFEHPGSCFKIPGFSKSLPTIRRNTNSHSFIILPPRYCSGCLNYRGHRRLCFYWNNSISYRFCMFIFILKQFLNTLLYNNVPIRYRFFA